MAEELKNFAVVRELSEEEESSTWIRSTVVLNPDINKLALISRLHKDKLFKFYTYAPNPEKLTDEEKHEIEEMASQRIKQQGEFFTSVNKRAVGLNHPNIVSVRDIGTDTKTGETLVLRDYPAGFPLDKIVDGIAVSGMIPVFLGLTRALMFIHQNRFLHLNLKPRRIRIIEDNHGFSVKLTDFGFALPFGAFDKNLNYGTPAFCAPEVALQEAEKVGEISDLYSLGIIMYYCMAKSLPFPRRSNVKDRHKLLDIIAKESEPMYPAEKNRHLLDLPQLDSIVYKIEPERIRKLEDIVMGLIKKNAKDRPFKTASKLQTAIIEIFPEARKSTLLSSASISYHSEVE